MLLDDFAVLLEDFDVILLDDCLLDEDSTSLEYESSSPGETDALEESSPQAARSASSDTSRNLIHMRIFILLQAILCSLTQKYLFSRPRGI
jgi:hypothetical protein